MKLFSNFREDGRISPKSRRELRAFVSDAGRDIKCLASRLGVNVFEERLPNEISAVLMRSNNRGGESGYVIVVNLEHPASRQRFSIAHELGHFVLHRDHPEFEVVDDTRDVAEVVPLFPVLGNSYRS